MNRILIRNHEMNPLTVKVAIACGWKFHAGSFNGSTTVTRPGEEKGWTTTESIPDYPNDLNAMHAAEKLLSEDRLWFMSARLADIVPAETPIAHANATQRAQAFLESCDKFLGEDDE